MQNRPARWQKPPFRYHPEQRADVLKALRPLRDSSLAEEAVRGTEDAAAWYKADLLAGLNTRDLPTAQERKRLLREIAEMLAPDADVTALRGRMSGALRSLLTSHDVKSGSHMWERAFDEAKLGQLPDAQLLERLRLLRPFVASAKAPRGPRPLQAERQAVSALSVVWGTFTRRGTSRSNRKKKLRPKSPRLKSPDSGPFHRYVRAALAPVRASMDPQEPLPDLRSIVREWHDRNRQVEQAHAALSRSDSN